jgi:hypothetical protein
MGEGFRAITTSLKGESDRGSIVLAAAWLDEALIRIIAKFFKPVSDNKENLLRAGQPIGDFGTRILLADRLNLMHPKLIQSLTLCRRLRNDFAHLSSDLSFETPSVKDRVDQLFRLNEDILATMGQVIEDTGKFGPPAGRPINASDMLDAFGHKQLFHYTCGFINAALAVIEYDIKPNEPLFDGS